MSPQADRIEFRPGGNILFAGPSAVEIYRATAIETALRLYAKTGLKVNRGFTPKAMLYTATAITGKTFKPRDYLAAADALHAWRKDPKNIPPVSTGEQPCV